MREIKFRAWDKKYNQMVLWDDISRTNIIGALINNSNRNISHGFLMQYTGLKDKNGVEIYFDDLVKINNVIYRVIELVGAVAFVCKTESLWNYACNLSANRFGEVIGNIYEHPHLLGGE